VSQDKVVVTPEDPDSPAGRELMARLTDELARLYSDDGGVLAFDPNDVRAPRGVFVIAWRNDESIGCGALRPMSEEIGEIKRMYVDPACRRQGVGFRILAALEEHARRFGYRSLRLETGILQPEAISLYEKSGYVRCPCYGFYAHDPRSVCFEKVLAEPIPPSLRDEGADLLIQAVRARTPARLLVGRAGPCYRTATQLELRQDHAAALDAVQAELELERDLGSDFVKHWQLFMVQTQSQSKAEFLLRPDLGRRLSPLASEKIREGCPSSADLQIVIGDGLSATAVKTQIPALLPQLDETARRMGLVVGQPFVVRYCRVGVLNDVGALLDPSVVVLLIGERPGLATAESLSAYLAHRPRPGDTDARRNLISNIHARGVLIPEAARRIVALAVKMRQLQTSGVDVKEDTLLLSGEW
jgi:ethanolamine ammonia-lyase small subunit